MQRSCIHEHPSATAIRYALGESSISLRICLSDRTLISLFHFEVYRSGALRCVHLPHYLPSALAVRWPCCRAFKFDVRGIQGHSRHTRLIIGTKFAFLSGFVLRRSSSLRSTQAQRTVAGWVRFFPTFAPAILVFWTILGSLMLPRLVMETFGRALGGWR